MVETSVLVETRGGGGGIDHTFVAVLLMRIKRYSQYNDLTVAWCARIEISL